MKPTYEVKAWKDDGWWLARVVAASDSADPTPLNALTQAKTLTKIEEMARDLIATILDADEGSFAVKVEYELPHDVDDLLRDTAGARAWLDAAQALWQERSAAAARALTAKGFSLREAAKLLGLSYQRVDQLLEERIDRAEPNVMAVEIKRYLTEGSYSRWTKIEPLRDVDLVLVISDSSEDHRAFVRSEWLSAIKERLGEAFSDIDIEARSTQGRSSSPALPGS